MLVIHKYLGDIYCVKRKLCIAEFAIYTYLLLFFDQGIEIIAPKCA